MGPVKSVENGRSMVLARIITDAKTKITGTPVTFDPKMMQQQHRQQRQQQNPRKACTVSTATVSPCRVESALIEDRKAARTKKGE
jgi:hypothetical protein